MVRRYILTDYDRGIVKRFIEGAPLQPRERRHLNLIYSRLSAPVLRRLTDDLRLIKALFRRKNGVIHRPRGPYRPEDCFWHLDGWCLLSPSRRCRKTCSGFIPKTAAWRPRP